MPRSPVVVSVGLLIASAAACSDAAPPGPSPSGGQTTTTESAIAAEAAPTPPPAMGWNSFDVLSSSRAGYGQTWLNEAHIEGASDAMQQLIQSAGYAYINIDSGWSTDYAWTTNSFDAYGVPMPDPERFPDGIVGVANYVHAKGQKLGLYAVVGLPGAVYSANYPIEGTSCHAQDIALQPLTNVPNGWYGQWEIDWSNPCSQAYYDSQANRYASWGVDLLKVDGTTAQNGPDIAAWQAALDQTGRSMWLTVSAWPVPLSLGPAIRQDGQSVRIDTDVDCYCTTISSWTSSVDQRWADLPSWLPYLGPGHYPDMDSMPISNDTGNGIQDGLSDVERQSVMSFWSIASAPLWVGGDIYFMDSTARAILTNPEVIAIDQSAVIPQQVASGTAPVWMKTLPDGTIAVGVFNLGSSTTSIQVSFSSLGFSGDADVRDVVARTDLGTFTDAWTAQNVPAHGSRLLELTRQPAIAGYTFCSSEYASCTLGGTTDVAFGAEGSYVFRSGLTGTIACDVATFGSDPAYGSRKGCYTRPHAGGGPASFTACASEGQTCSPDGDVDVAFGAVGSFRYRTGVVSSFACSNDTFGSDPAYGWTKGCYTRPSGGGVAFEAEAATLSGAAAVTSCSSCAGGKKVGYIGNGSGNTVTFPQVDVSWGGSHTLVVHGVSADARTFSVTVNGGAAISVPVQSGSWSTPTTAGITVPLQAGINSITFGNGGAYAPDLDRIVVW
jgi:hypothetical protein